MNKNKRDLLKGLAIGSAWSTPEPVSKSPLYCYP